MKKQTNLALPEWAFLDAKTQQGDELQGRDVLLHVRTNTMLEFFEHGEVKLNEDVKQKEFTFTNQFGVTERHVVAIHYSVAEFGNLADVVDKAIQFYIEWMKWMDSDIQNEETAKHN